MESKSPLGKHGYLLKIAIFATGISGIVAEYLLATLATYFLGDSIFQWTMIVSVMLFSMGIGSLMSRKITKELLFKFLTLELLLSLLASFSVVIIYYVAGYFKGYVTFYIYFLSISIGILIGMEIPLVTRINDSYEELKRNISSIMAMDYIGSLIGGVFFAFWGLPRLGLTYTPFVVGGINFLVAMSLFIIIWKKIERKKSALILSTITAVILLVGLFTSDEVKRFSEQKRYKEKIIFQEQTRYQNIVITQKKDVFWLFINGNQQLSTLDEYVYHEALVHPSIHLAKDKKKILILGGGDGCVAREALKYKEVEKIVLVDLDSVMTDIAREHWVLSELNHESLDNSKVTIINADAFTWLENQQEKFDVIIVDLPDPKSIDLSRMYSKEFYWVCRANLAEGGSIVTQAGSPMFATEAYECINLSMKAAGFSTLTLHNHVLTLGEWGYIIGKIETQSNLDKEALAFNLRSDISTAWLNNEAFEGMQKFGKPHVDLSEVQVNTISEPILQKYYLRGNWDFYR